MELFKKIGQKIEQKADREINNAKYQTERKIDNAVDNKINETERTLRTASRNT